jgi:hypothetical protein
MVLKVDLVRPSSTTPAAREVKEGSEAAASCSWVLARSRADAAAPDSRSSQSEVAQ